MEKTEADYLYAYAKKNWAFFADPDGIPYVKMYAKALEMRSTAFDDLLRDKYKKVRGRIISTSSLDRVKEMIGSESRRHIARQLVYQRVSAQGGKLFYDLANGNISTAEPPAFIQVTANGVQCVNQSPLMFAINEDQEPQPEPDTQVKADELLTLLKANFHLAHEKDYLLLACFLVACFIPDIEHPVCIFHGEKGAAKTTALNMLVQIIDPHKTGILSLPAKIEDLALMLHKHYIVGFDNLQRLKQDHSDILCMSCTGGRYTRRTLYSNDGITAWDLKCIVALTGIQIVATQPDLLDRSIVIRMEKLDETEYKTKSEVAKQFQKAKPQILGAVFDCLSQVLGRIKQVKLSAMTRMGDFCRYGYAIAEVLTGDGNRFLEVYRENISQVKEFIVTDDSLMQTLEVFMTEKSSFKGTCTELLNQLRETAQAKRIRIATDFPSTPNLLSQKINTATSELAAMGIQVEHKSLNRGRTIILRKKASSSTVQDKLPHRK